MLYFLQFSYENEIDLIRRSVMKHNIYIFHKWYYSWKKIKVDTVEEFVKKKILKREKRKKTKKDKTEKCKEKTEKWQKSLATCWQMIGPDGAAEAGCSSPFVVSFESLNVCL